MKAYLWTTSVVFALLTLMHVWRIVAESRQLAREPWFLIITVLSAGLSLWAFRLARRANRA